MRDFRAGAREFFTAGRPGPKTAPAKDAARPRIIELRAAGHSIDEIAQALAAEGTPLNRTGIAEVIADEGLPRMWRRPDAERGGPAREIQARAEALDFTALSGRAETRLAGLFLAIPDLIALGVPDMVTAAGYPSTPRIPALSYVLSLLALKLTSTRRVSHVYDIAADPGAALFAGLTALPKATALTTYSYRLEHPRQAAFLAALDKAALAAGLAEGEALNLDFHAVMHWGEDPVLEKHYVPRRSQRTRSVLTFFAEDAATRTLVYANADLAKASQNREVIAFADHWKAVTGHDPALLIFDSKLTTQAVLAELDDRQDRVHHAARPPPRHHQDPGRPAPKRLEIHDPRPGRRARPAASKCTTTPPPPVGLPAPDPPARRHRPGPRPAHPADHQPAQLRPGRSSAPTPGG